MRTILTEDEFARNCLLAEIEQLQEKQLGFCTHCGNLIDSDNTHAGMCEFLVGPYRRDNDGTYYRINFTDAVICEPCADELMNLLAPMIRDWLIWWRKPTKIRDIPIEVGEVTHASSSPVKCECGGKYQLIHRGGIPVLLCSKCLVEKFLP